MCKCQNVIRRFMFKVICGTYAYKKFIILITIHVVLDKYLAYLVVLMYVKTLCKLKYKAFYYKTLFL